MAVPFVAQKQVAHFALFHYGRKQEQVRLAVCVVIQLYHRSAKTISNGREYISVSRLLNVGSAGPFCARRKVRLKMLARTEPRHRTHSPRRDTLYSTTH